MISLRDTSTSELAAYTYGPYGETTGAIGSRWASNPFRFSTKFTDAERGLVYYGYRYYMPGVGRWAGRDPIGERGGANVTAFVRNRSANYVDPTGLRPIPIEFNAFINGTRRGRWLPEPGPPPIFPLFPERQRVREFATNWRDFGQSNHNLANPNAKLMSRATVESSMIGSFNALLSGGSATGLSHRRWSPDADGPVLPELDPSVIETARASVSDGAPKEEQSGPPCETRIRFNPSAGYPFIAISPAIDFDVTFILKVVIPGWVSIGVSGVHDRFPDYEAYGDDILGYQTFSPSSGPGINLTMVMPIRLERDDIAWIASVIADTPCGCPK